MDQTVTSGAPSDGAMMDTADWQARAGHVREVLAGAPDTAVAAALGAFLFADDAGKTWTYNGALWMSWDGTQWSEGTAPASLRLQPFLREAEPATESAAEAAPAETPTKAATESPTTTTDALSAATPSMGTGMSSTMTADTPASSASAEKPAEEPAVVDAAPVAELPAMADSYPMAELATSTASTAPTVDEAVAAAATKSTELVADKAEASWSSSASTVDKPALSDMATATTADLTAPASDFASRMSEAPTTPATSQPASGSAAASMPAAMPSSTPMSTATTASTAAAAASMPATGAFKATHAAPPAGMGAWTRPDPSVRPEYQLAARTELMVTEMLSSGWAHVAGSNGWTGWVDGRQLVSLQAAASAATPAMGQPTSQPAQPVQQPAAQWQPSQPAAQPVQQPAAQWQPSQPAAQTTPSWQPSQPAAQTTPQVTPAAQPSAAAQTAGAPFRATHAVPPMGMPAWAQPNPALPPAAQLAPGTQLMVAEWSQSGWARVVATNGWSGWVDGRMLVAFGQAPYQR